MRVPVERFTPSLAYSAPPIVHDVRHGRERLDVVDDGRLRVEALDRGERRPDARHAPLAFERSRAARSPRRRCTRPRRGARRCRGRSRSRGCSCRGSPSPRASAIASRQPFVAERELTAQVDEREVALDRVRRDRDALDELVRIALDEHAVLERRRLAFVGVDHEVARERVGGQERPLLRGREARAAAAAQARQLHLLLHVGRVALGEHRAQRPRTRPTRARRRSSTSRRDGRAAACVTMRVSCTRRAHAPALPRSCARVRAARLVVVDDRPPRSRRHALVELVVHLHRRRAAARGEALDLFDGDVGSSSRSARSRCSRISGPPVTRHVTFVHTDTTSFPHGRRLNIV